MADQGGGVWNQGDLTITGCIIRDNHSFAVESGTGGGLYNSGTLTIVSCTIEGNSARGGGGMANYGAGNAKVVSSTLADNLSYYGGGVDNQGTLAVDSCVIQDNTARYTGGGICSPGTATVVSCTIEGNTAEGFDGGGIYNANTLKVTSSTIANNSADRGGGILTGGTWTVTSSTITGNSTVNGWRGNGGGIFNCGSGTVTSSTIAGNSALDGGGLYNSPIDNGPVTLTNTIVAQNVVSGSPQDIQGSIATSSHNLVGVDSGLSGVNNGVGGNIVGTAAAPIDPMLGPLQDNGGPTWTMALLPGSPAINAGDSTNAPPTDQRGFARVGTPDFGAFEFQSVLAGPIQNPANGHEYYLLTQSNWTDAEAQAVALGGHLATINDAAENAWVVSNFSEYGGVHRCLWIGLNDEAVEGTFAWVSGEPVTYTNWGAGEPNNFQGNEDYVHIMNSLDIYGRYTYWNDAPDDANAFGYVFDGVVEVGGAQIDTTPPTTTATLSGTEGSPGWYVGPVMVALNATDPDDAAGSLVTTVSLDGGPTATYDPAYPLRIIGDGVHTLTYQSRDPAGNVEALKTQVIRIGQPLPATNLLVNGDFSQGNTGFTSQLDYIPIHGTHWGPSYYGIVHNPSTEIWDAFGNFGDHTTGSGLMFASDGPTDPNTVVWQETVNVARGTDYVFSGWARLDGASPDRDPIRPQSGDTRLLRQRRADRLAFHRPQPERPVVAVLDALEFRHQFRGHDQDHRPEHCRRRERLHDGRSLLHGHCRPASAAICGARHRRRPVRSDERPDRCPARSRGQALPGGCQRHALECPRERGVLHHHPRPARR